jgi:hypothetical protein
MKKLFLLLSMFCMLTDVYAQENLKASEGDFGFSFGINGLINNVNITNLHDINNQAQLNFRYFIKDDIALRFGTSFNSMSFKQSMVDSVGNAKVEFDSTLKRFNSFINLGVEKHFEGTKRLDPYIGMRLDLGSLGRLTGRSVTTTTDTTGIDKREIDSQFMGGVMWGITGIVGFQYFVAPKFCLGAEYIMGFRSIRDGGDYNIVSINSPISGNSIVQREVGSNLTKEAGLVFPTNLSVTISYYFSGSKSKS